MSRDRCRDALGEGAALAKTGAWQLDPAAKRLVEMAAELKREIGGQC